MTLPWCTTDTALGQLLTSCLHQHHQQNTGCKVLQIDHRMSGMGIHDRRDKCHLVYCVMMFILVDSCYP